MRLNKNTHAKMNKLPTVRRAVLKRRMTPAAMKHKPIPPRYMPNLDNSRSFKAMKNPRITMSRANLFTKANQADDSFISTTFNQTSGIINSKNWFCLPIEHTHCTL